MVTLGISEKMRKHPPPHKLIYNMTNKFHVLPVNDIREHQENGVICECKPEIRIEDEENWLIIHNAWDGREWEELANGMNY